MVIHQNAISGTDNNVELNNTNKSQNKSMLNTMKTTYIFAFIAFLVNDRH